MFLGTLIARLRIDTKHFQQNVAFKDFQVTIGKFIINILKLPEVLYTITKGLKKLDSWYVCWSSRGH